LIGSFAGVSFDADDEEDPESSEEGTGRAIEDTENII
jgi:hypothetical protein